MEKYHSKLFSLLIIKLWCLQRQRMLTGLGRVDSRLWQLLRQGFEDIWRQKTLKSFVQAHPKGTFVVMVAKHALTIKDGELLDWDSNKFQPTRKVQDAYELKSLTKNKVGTQLSLF